MLVDERDDATECRRRGRGAVDQADTAVDRDGIVRAVGGYVGVAAHSFRIVVLSRGIAGLVVGEVGFHS